MIFDEPKDEYPGKEGTPGKDACEPELKAELPGKKIRKEIHTPRKEPGKLTGMNKSQISKPERGTRSTIVGTIIISGAFRKNIEFAIEDPGKNLQAKSDADSSQTERGIYKTKLLTCLAGKFLNQYVNFAFNY